MSIIGSNILAGASGNQGYNLNNSLRFRSSASAYLNRTAGSTTNRQTWTWSGWVKRGTLGARQHIFVSANPVVNTTSQQEFQICFDSSDKIEVSGSVSGVSTDLTLNTTQVFRDPSAWYHLVVAVDTTQATAANRIKLYINGVQVTAFSTATYPAQNYNTSVNLTGFSHRIGGSGGSYLDAYQAEINFVDGSQLTPSSFGETSATTGQWIPKKYTSTYGTNGFYLNFSDTSAATAAIGKDSSGNGNNWTPSGISVTAGTTYDAMLDVPTNTSATVANYAVLNPLTPAFSDTASASITNGNLTATGNAGYGFATIIPTSGKWYFEAVGNSAFTSVGIWFPPFTQSTNGYSNTNYRYYGVDGKLYNQAGTVIQSYSTYGSADIIGVALDLDNGKVYFSKNNTWQGSSDPVAGTSPAVSSLSTGWVFGVVCSSGTVINCNFGQRPFSYTPPSGFKALNTFNLPDSTIVKGNKYMDATTYTGTGASLAITNTGAFQPDFVWVKGRSGATSHALYDSVRGTTKDLVSDSTAAETTQTTGLTAFGTGGFTVGALAKMNTSAATYVGWQWKASNTTAVSGTGTGGVTSVTYSANTTAGFSIVQYTETSSSGTATHGLGVAPSFIITKDLSGANNWNCYHVSLGATKRIQLNSTAAADVQAGVWNNTAPTSSVFTLGSSLATAGAKIAYCFAEITGFSKFTSYTGNGSADGVFVFLGFRPKWVMLKNTGAVGHWYVLDTARNTYNVMDTVLLPSASNADTTITSIDCLSNGFKLRTTSSDINGSGTVYIVAAFAENPFKNSNAR